MVLVIFESNYFPKSLANHQYLPSLQKAASPSYLLPGLRSQNHSLPYLMCWILINNSQFMNREL